MFYALEPVNRHFSSFNMDEGAEAKVSLCKWSRRAGIHSLV